MPKPRERQEPLPEHILVHASKPGPVRCLKCSKTFQSADKMRLRICPSCTKTNDDAFVRREISPPPGWMGDIDDG
jgi:Zn finger protein HypA/HybF involved in hydrogenase expression